MNLSERITMNPEICHGKPTIRGLRYTVEFILELLSSEWLLMRSWPTTKIWSERISSQH